ncbi:MAG: carboxypeptidase regulatory-like domain-containing protein [Bacteroidaceae bacterium]|nr:carboxypeptidase regulatory-like domain-containing protein [Bacteroidaceae bacterium]
MKKLFSICIVLLCQMAAFAQSENTKHTITILADPEGSSTVYYSWQYVSSIEKETGEQVVLTVDPSTGYVLDTLVSAEIDTKNVSNYDNQWTISFTMPDKDVTITAHAHYAPELPANPNESGWDEGTGSIVVNHFAPGGLYGAISNTLYNPETYNADLSKVTAITAVGTITEGDWQSILLYNYFENLTYLDLSRTVGLSELGIRYYNPGSRDNETLTTLLLPATIDSIGNYAYLDRLKALKSLTIYATTPPKLITDDLEQLPADMVLYVPAESLPLYMEADGWKDLEIQPITQGVHSLTVNLPQGTATGSFKDLFLELVNTETARVQRYVMTSSTQYTFPNLIDDTQYNIYIRNARGDILASIEAVDVKGKNVSVTFAEVTTPQDITLQLLTPNGKDVTDQATTTWTDQRGNYIATGNTLGSQMNGTQVRFSVKLPEALGILYQLPTDSLITVGENATLSVRLQPLPQVELSGTVTAEATDSPIRNANIAVTQLLNGRYSQTLTTTTDANGNWTLTVPDAPATITAAADNYVSATLAVEAFPASTPVAFALRDLTGTRLYLNIYYRPAVREGEMMDGDEAYADYQGISYTVYDETHQRELTSMKVQYPYMVLQDEELAEGTQLRVTATSSTGAFMPVTATCQVKADDSTIVTLPITQLGQLKATFSQTDNLAVVGLLYDGDGNLRGTYSYDEAQLTLTDIPDGDYTLVTMGESRLFNGINTLDGLTEMGLEAGREYVSNTVSIESGRIDSLHNQVIPSFDETIFSYTTDDTQFSANKTQVTVGNYVTLRTQVAYKNSVTPRKVKMLFDLPEGCALVENSVMAGTSLTSYSMDGNRLTVPLANATDIVRFCVVPTKEGYYETQASVTFTSAARERIQPLGSVGITAEALSISVPQRSGSGIVPVSGTAIGGSQVQIYDDEVLIGQTEASPAGYWKVQCALNNPYNLSEHTIYALITTPDGVQMPTAASTVTINHGTLKPVVTMSFDQDGRQATLTWDFRTNTVSSPSYWARYVNNMFPVGFDINLMDEEDTVSNDTTVVSNVVLYVLLENNTVMTLYPRYNTKKGCWYAAFNYDHVDAMPINVYVDFVQDETLLADRDEQDRQLDEILDAIAEGQQMAREVYAFANDDDPEYEGKAIYDELQQLLDTDNPDEATTARIDSLFTLVLGKDAIESAVLEEQPLIDELEQLLALPVDQITAQTEARIESLLDGIMAVKQPDSSELIALLDTLDARKQEWCDEILSMLAMGVVTDTTALQAPAGDATYEVEGLFNNKYYTSTKLGTIDVEALLAEGYEEMPMTDGTSIYYFVSGTTAKYVDTRNATLYTLELKEQMATATQRRAMKILNENFIFDQECRATVLDFALNLQKLAGQLALQSPTHEAAVINLQTQGCTLLKQTPATLNCLFKSGIENIEKGVKDAYNGFIAKLQPREKAAQDAVELADKQLKEAVRRRQKWEHLRTSFKAKGLELEAQRLVAMLESPEKVADIDKWIARNKAALGTIETGVSDAVKWVGKANKNIRTASKALKDIQNAFNEIKAAKDFVLGITDKFPKDLRQWSKATKWTGYAGKLVGTVIGAVLQIYPLYCLTEDITNDMLSWYGTYLAIKAKIPCEAKPLEANMLMVETVGNILNYGKMAIDQWCLDAGALALDIVSLTGVTPTWYVSIIMDVASVALAIFRPGLSQGARRGLDARIRALDCTPKPKKPKNTHMLGVADRNWETICFGNPCPESKPVRDPSGFVYEAVNSNRLEGVTATCYYKETVEDMYGDLHENIVVWDAENYAQENPLFTDSEGKYAWDVPQGLWQVKFEKEGYETTRSEWLPVPPPQLEVNVGMTQLRQPVVSRVKAYPEGIDITFDKYMRPKTLTAENIFVTKGGQTIGGKMELLNSDSGYETPDSVYASKVRFVPSTPLTANDKVQLTVRKTVESYAGIQMESDYTQQFDVELRVLSIETDSLLYMADEATQSLTVQALPVEAAKGKSLSVTSISPDVVALNTDVLTLDANGSAQVTLTATGLGNSTVKFSLTDDDLTASTFIYVEDAANMMAADPTASRMSGTEIYRGSEIKLSCQTAGATILYTLDGSCPCDADSKNVLTYQGPIVATGESLVIRAMAVANGMSESDVVEFRYKVVDPPVFIETVTTDDGIQTKVAVAYYRLDGRRTARLQKGINIVRHSDGQVKKVLIK